MIIHLEVKSSYNVMKVIDALTTPEVFYTFTVTCDELQAQKPDHERFYIVEIRDLDDINSDHA